METETLSNYEQKHPDNPTDLGNEDSPANQLFRKITESTETENDAGGKTNANRIEIESDDECEEEEEKLLLSPAHSDKCYDSDDAGDPLSPPLNRELEESDTEADIPEKINNDVSKTEEYSENLQNKLADTSENSEHGNDDKIRTNCDTVQEKNVDISSDKEMEQNKSEGNTTTEETKKAKEEEVKDIERNILEEDVSVSNKDEITDNSKTERRISVEYVSVSNKEDEITDNSKTERNISEEYVSVSNKDDEITDNSKTERNISEEYVSVSNKEDEITDHSKIENEYIEKTNEDPLKCDDTNSEPEKIIQVDENEDILECENTTDNKSTKKTKKKTSVKRKKAADKEIKKCEKSSEKVTENKSKVNENSLLKETLNKPMNDGNEVDDDEEMDMDEDFDPSLLCPELSMEVDEAPVITTNDAPVPESDNSKSPLQLYDPIFSTFVDEMTGAEVDFNLTAEELDLKAKTYGPKNPIQFTKIHCTACNVHLGSALDGQGNRFVHPLLKVLICKKCYHFYTSGEFEKDEDGSELYCRWCGQGGQVLCCSNCEMVFCKKCIRINFDRKKLSDIQKSDDWLCFRCNSSQLIHLRIHCCEFMEYVQSQLRCASSSGNVDAFMNTDYCQCCVPQKKKAPDVPSTSQPKKKRRLMDADDPDYDPVKDRDVSPPTPSIPPPAPSQTTSIKPPLLNPRLATSSGLHRPNILRPSLIGQPRPRVQVITPPTVRPQQQGFVKVMPGGVRITSPSTLNTPTRPPTLRPIRPSLAMKHEWFEKTVRAAARVNSNLSYTLTQLNRAQANAPSVEALAVVHNKLQEILSSSINSLIQIRKNLRTEFIAGIKNIRFPTKAQPSSTPSTSKDDDDVIFISSDPEPNPLPPPLIPANTNSPNNKINLPPSISLVKKSPNASPVATKTSPSNTIITIKSTGSSAVAKKSTSAADDTSSRPKGFLRVKSFSALQSVPAECITIPDDPPEEIVSEEKDPLDVSDVVDLDSFDTDKDTEVTNGDHNEQKNDENVEKVHQNVEKDDQIELKDDQNEQKEDKIPTTINTIKDAAALDKFKPAKIILQRSEVIDALVKTKFQVLNGDSH